MAMAAKVKGFVPKTFNDAGTGQTFEGGKEHEFEAGVHANYLAAGLIGEAPAQPVPETETTKAKA
jgi:hypothetical protein